jgi:hypothetical protein
MKIRIVYYLFVLLFSVSFTSCTDHKSKKDNESTSPKIEYLRETQIDGKFFLFHNFQDNELCIRYLFNFSKQRKGNFVIITDESAVEFNNYEAVYDEHGHTEIFMFKTLNDSFKFIILRPIVELKRNRFFEKIYPHKLEVVSDQVELNINLLQNFINLCYDREIIQKHKTYTYELYNKDKVKKVVITYHNYGEWFEVEIL